MFTTIKAHYAGNEKSYIEAACLSTDTKPTDGIANGSACIEMDTGDKYMFDEAGGQWIKLGSGDGDAEIWFTSDTYTESESMRIFTTNDNVDHISELYNNYDKYPTLFVNDTELTLDQERLWYDDANSPTVALSALMGEGITPAVIITYVDGSTAPDSVEVSVKAK